MAVLVSWSSGKDSAWTLHALRREGIEVRGLLTTIDRDSARVSMHRVHRTLVHAQASALRVPVWEVPLPSPCPDDEYRRRMDDVVRRAEATGITHVAFGDLFLQDVRAYREATMAPTGIDPLFPIWCGEDGTDALAREMVAAGVRAVITCVDGSMLPPSFLGQEWDPAALPDGVDPLGERGEFHTFCRAGPMFPRPLSVVPGEVSEDQKFWWVDLTSAADARSDRRDRGGRSG